LDGHSFFLALNGKCQAASENIPKEKCGGPDEAAYVESHLWWAKAKAMNRLFFSFSNLTAGIFYAPLRFNSFAIF
jgi:hypothetical protein